MIRPIRPKENAVAGEATLPHVLLVVDQFPKALGGGERVLLRLAELLPSYGYRVSILTFAIHPESIVLTDGATCPLYLLPLSRTYDLTALQGAFALRHFLRQQKIVLVQTFFESSDLWAGAVVKAFSSAKLIWSRRDMGILRGRKHEVAYRLLAWLPDRVFAVSERVREHCIVVDGIAPDKVTAIYNGLDLDAWKEVPGLSRVTDDLVITTVGNVRRVKGHDILLRAAAIILKRFPGCSFTVAGEVLEPEYFQEVQQMLREMNLVHRFRFLGGIANLRDHLRTADIFVLPSRSEGFSNAIIEAMAGGLPVVATDVGGNGEAVQDGVTGFLVAPEDSEALAVAILRLLEEPEAARRMGIAGSTRVATTFTTRAMMRQVVKAYADLLRP